MSEVDIVYRRWSSEERVFLLANHRSMSAAQIAKELGRTADSVIQKAHRLGLRFVSPDHPESDFDPKCKCIVCGRAITHGKTCSPRCRMQPA